MSSPTKRSPTSSRFCAPPVKKRTAASSLKFYKDLFSQRLQRAEKNDDVPERLKILIDDVSLNMFTNICRGLFEKDKMIYAFMIAVGILRQAGRVSDLEWRTLLVGAVVMEASGNDDTGDAKMRAADRGFSFRTDCFTYAYMPGYRAKECARWWRCYR